MSKVHTLLKATRHTAPYPGVTDRNPMTSAKATNPKELLIVLMRSMGSGKGHVTILET